MPHNTSKKRRLCKQGEGEWPPAGNIFHPATAGDADGAVPALKHCTINGIEGEYYPSSNSGTSNLIWVGTEQGILFAIDSTLEKPVILHIAESVSLTDSTK